MERIAPLSSNDDARTDEDAEMIAMLEQRVAQLQRHLEREKSARLEAEAIAETGLRDLYESKQRLSMLQAVTELANRSNDYTLTIRAVLGEICNAFGWEVGNAFFLGPDHVLQSTDSVYLFDIDGMQDFSELSRRAVLGAKQGLPGQVIEMGRPVWLNDLTHLEDDPRHGVARRARLISACAFPVMLDREIVAVLEFYSRHALRENEDLNAVMLQVGHQLGQVVERQRSWRLLQSAKHDELTGLPGRAILVEKANEAFGRPGSRRRDMAMLVLDLNGFKAVNDRHGHHFGDLLLTKVAKRLKRRLARWTAKQDCGCKTLLARTGGDEFVVLMSGCDCHDTVEAIAAEMHGALDRPFTLGELEVEVGASIGIATCDTHYEDVDSLARDADLAMYQAKSMGPDCTVAFTHELGQRVRERRQVERELRDAIGEGQFVLHYQPIYALDGTHALRGYEALVRWQHPVRGILPPSEFIACAEETGLIAAIGHWVLQEACSAIARMPACEDGSLPFIAVNVAPDQFLQSSFVDQVRNAIMRAGIRPERLKIEITENVAIIDAVQTADILSEMRAWGVQASLDDFGTGYSSLIYLQNLPLDSFKIDRSFVSSLDDERSGNIIRAMCDLARELGLTIVAEGIETEEQAELLARLGCHQGQGFLFGHPEIEARAFAALTERAQAA